MPTSCKIHVVDLVRELLVTLRQRFGEFDVETTAQGETSIRFAAKHPAVGDAVIIVESDEVTIHIGSITHGHFNRFDLNEVERAQAIACDVECFLASLFTDQVILWSRRMSGGWRVLGDGERPNPKADVETFVWSGPLG
jgi:hypothetical protein